MAMGGYSPVAMGRGRYSLAFCHGPDGLDELKGWVHPQQKTGVAQVQHGPYATVLPANGDIHEWLY